MRLLLALLSLLLLGAAWAEPPQPFTASYTLSASGMRAAESSRALRHMGDGVWEFQTVAKPVGVASLFIRDTILEHSRWRLNGGKVVPLSYEYRQSGGRRERHREIAFDYQEGLIQSTLGAEAWALPPNVQDLASVQIALMLDVSQGRKVMEYPVADGRSVETYRFEVQGEGHMDTPAGRFRTVRVETKDAERQRSMTFWMAPELGYLPVRIEQRDADRAVGVLVLMLNNVVGDPG